MPKKFIAQETGNVTFEDKSGKTFAKEYEKILVAIVANGDATAVATGINFRLDTPEVLGFLGDVMDACEDSEL